MSPLARSQTEQDCLSREGVLAWTRDVGRWTVSPLSDPGILDPVRAMLALDAGRSMRGRAAAPQRRTGLPIP